MALLRMKIINVIFILVNKMFLINYKFVHFVCVYVYYLPDYEYQNHFEPITLLLFAPTTPILAAAVAATLSLVNFLITKKIS